MRIGRIFFLVGFPFRWFFGFIKNRRDEILAVATVSLAILAAFQFWALWETDSTMKKSNRAFVYFKTITYRPYPTKEPTAFGIEMTVINPGNVPTRELRLYFACKTVPVEDNREPVSLVDWKSLKPDSLKLLGPGQVVDLQACPNIGVENDSGTKAGNLKTFIFAMARYQDGFNSMPRVTQLVQRLYFDATGGRSFDFVANCADDDCPK